MTFLPSAEQESALEAFERWWKRGAEGPFRLFGPAGTGKTTIAQMFHRRLGIPPILAGAYTGKAVSVLKRKGMCASTIHSAIYHPAGNAAQIKEYERLCAIIDDPGSSKKEEREARQAKRALLKEMSPVFELNIDAPWSREPAVLLDEVSMIGTKLGGDMAMLGMPIIALGDPYQLGPVKDSPFFGREADFLLTEIHRQAEGSPVLDIAERARNGQRVPVTPWSIEVANAADQTIVRSNVMRWRMIEKMRAARGLEPGIPVAGDRVMCIANNKHISGGIYNGMQFAVHSAKTSDGYHELNLIDDQDEPHTIRTRPDGFEGLERQTEAEKVLKSFREGDPALFTFADAITCHKAQGSEWDRVYVINEPGGNDMERRRWLYTAVTRASSQVVISGESR